MRAAAVSGNSLTIKISLNNSNGQCENTDSFLQKSIGMYLREGGFDRMLCLS